MAHEAEEIQAITEITLPVEHVTDPRFLAIWKAIRFASIDGRPATMLDADAIYLEVAKVDPNLGEKLTRMAAALDSLERVYVNSVGPKVDATLTEVRRISFNGQTARQPQVIETDKPTELAKPDLGTALAAEAPAPPL